MPKRTECAFESCIHKTMAKPFTGLKIQVRINEPQSLWRVISWRPELFTNHQVVFSVVSSSNIHDLYECSALSRSKKSGDGKGAQLHEISLDWFFIVVILVGLNESHRRLWLKSMKEHFIEDEQNRETSVHIMFPVMRVSEALIITTNSVRNDCLVRFERFCEPLSNVLQIDTKTRNCNRIGVFDFVVKRVPAEMESSGFSWNHESWSYVL